MKNLLKIVWSFTLVLTMFSVVSADSLFGKKSQKPPKKAATSFNALVPTLNNPLCYSLSSIYNAQVDECRIPLNLGSGFFINPTNGKVFQRFSKDKSSLNPTEIGEYSYELKGNSVYKKGNSYLLLPHPYENVVVPGVNGETPRVIYAN